MSIKQLPHLNSLLVGVGVVLLVTLATTFYCGDRTGRFRSLKGIDESRRLLKELPLTIKDWVAEEEGELDSHSIHELRIENGYVARRYKNQTTRSEVNFVLMLGPTGRVVVHTPEICFGGRNFERENDTTSVSIPIPTPSENGPTDETFWRVSFVNRSLRGEKIAFYYAVSSGNEWEAVDNPRSSFSRFRYVYKIQVESVIGFDNADPAYAFLVDALPTIHQYMKPCQ